MVVVTWLMSCSAYFPRLVVYQKNRGFVFADIVSSSFRLDLLVLRFDKGRGFMLLWRWLSYRPRRYNKVDILVSNGLLILLSLPEEALPMGQ